MGFLGSDEERYLRVHTLDGTTVVNTVTDITVSDGTLTDLGGGHVQITTGGGGGGTPGSPDLSVQVNVSGVFTGSSKFLYDDSGPTLLTGDGTGEFVIVNPAGAGSALRLLSNEAQQPYVLLSGTDGDNKNTIILGFNSPADTDTNGGGIVMGGNDGNGAGHGGGVFFTGGQGGLTDGVGGDIQFNGGIGFFNGEGGSILFDAGDMSGAGNGHGGDVFFRAGSGNFVSGTSTGGDVNFYVGQGFGGGADGRLIFGTRSVSKGVNIDLSGLTASHNITFNDTDGVIYNLPDPGNHTIAGWDEIYNRPVNFTIGTGLSYDHSTQTLSASGVSSTNWNEDGSLVVSGDTANFIEPDTTLITDNAGVADINMSKYVLLGGRAGGQTIYGETTSGGGAIVLNPNTSGVVGTASGNTPTGVSIGDNVTLITSQYQVIALPGTADVDLSNSPTGVFGGVLAAMNINLLHVYPEPLMGMFYSYLFLDGNNFIGNDKSMAFKATNACTGQLTGDTGNLEVSVMTFDFYNPTFNTINGGTVTVDNFYGFYDKPAMYDSITIISRVGYAFIDADNFGIGSSIGSAAALLVGPQTVTGDSYSVISLGNTTYLQNYGRASFGIDPNSFQPSSCLDIGQPGSGFDLLRMFTGSDNSGTPVTAFNSDGKNYRYNADDTVGNGLTSVLGSVSLQGQTASIGDTTILTSADNSCYRIGIYIINTGSAVGTITAKVTWNDETATVQSFTTPSINFATADNFSQASILVNQRGGNVITYQTTAVGVVGTPSYSLYITVERIT